MMYAKNLSLRLHRCLSETQSYGDSLQRFEKLRSYNQLPRGRDTAGRRLTNEEIACAILGFVPTQSGWAGHVALIMGDLRPVGGVGASFQKTATVKVAIAKVLSEDDHCNALVSLALSVSRIPRNDKYQAKLIFDEDGHRKTVSYVSKYEMLSGAGAEKNFDHDRLQSTNTRQLILSHMFFRDLKRDVDLSRQLNSPLVTNWREYETEEERDAFHKRLGAQKYSSFLNLGVNTNVTWPQEPTRIEFGGHQFVLFPNTKDHSHSISIDLKGENITPEEARTLLNRFLSLLSWCDDKHAILRNSWSGNPVPVPVQRRDMSTRAMPHWTFYRSISTDEELLRRLSYYREGLNAAEANISSQVVLSFFKVFEMDREGSGVRTWIARVFDEACADVRPEILKIFNEERKKTSIEKYVYKNCRVATAHASKDYPSDSDASTEIYRLSIAAEIIQALARYYIRETFNLSESYLIDELD